MVPTNADDAAAGSPAFLAEASQRGASLVEYALLLSMIALVAIAAVELLGGATAGQLSSAAELFPD